MSISDEELELQLSEAGNKLLLDPPSSVDDLLPFLDKVEGLLSKVEQSPPESILDTLASFVKALIDDKLITHSDEEIKVVVASCISEITRITAPDAPYEDQQMKDVFRLIVSSFENLHDKSSRSYAKRTSILETVARVRSCVVMLDLECHTLILEMFQHFLKSVREYHPKNVIESMVTIMTLIIEESEDVSPELLSCLLACVRKDSKEVSPVAQELVETVLRNCALILKPCFGEVLQTLGSSLDDYNDVVMTIFRDAGAFGINHKHAMEEHKVDKPVPPRIDPALRKPKLRITNMVIQKKEADSVSEKEEHRNPGSQSKSDAASGDNNVKELVDEDEDNLESLRVNRKRKGRQLDGSQNSRKKEAKKLHRTKKERNNGNLDDELPSEDKKKVSSETSPKGEDGENLSMVSAFKSMTKQVGKLSKKQGRKKKREESKGFVCGATELSENELEEMSDSEAKDQLHSCPKVSAGDSADAKSAITLKISRKINDASGEAEEKHAKSSSKKVNRSKIVRDGSSVKKQKSKKQLSSEKEATETRVEKSAVKQKKKATSFSKLLSKTSKDKVQSSETPKVFKGKDTPGKKSSDVKGYGMDLVGSKVRVWWPRDHQFYEGVVDSFDSGKKKHKVVYSDGDEETLNLQKEKWELVAQATGSDQGQGHEDGSSDGSPELPLKERVKKGMEESAAKEGKKEVTSKKVRDASSSKGKFTSLKSGQKTGVGKTGKNSKNKSKDPDALSGRKPDASSRKADKSDDVVEKAANLDEPDDDDLLSLRASIKSIKSKGRAGKTKDLKSSSGEDKSKSGAKQERMDSDGLENQKVDALSTPEGGNEKTDALNTPKGGNEKTSNAEDAAEGDEPKEEESCVPEKEKGTVSKTGKKRSREA